MLQATSLSSRYPTASPKLLTKTLISITATSVCRISGKRLELLYPSTGQLKIMDEEEVFLAVLELSISQKPPGNLYRMKIRTIIVDDEPHAIEVIETTSKNSASLRWWVRMSFRLRYSAKTSTCMDFWISKCRAMTGIFVIGSL